MLSYQHMYHAGGLADVHKHVALSIMLAKLAENTEPLSYVETHAGRGLYDLASKEAAKTKEAEQGIVRLRRDGGARPDPAYLAAIADCSRTHGETSYPGSPLIANNLLRATDRLHLCELHPREVEGLRRVMGRRAQIHQKDGYGDVLRRAPFDPRRGFVLIDPSYEIKSEYEAAAEFILSLREKWPVVTIMLWYPLLERGLHVAMLEQLRSKPLPKMWMQEVAFDPDHRSRALGSGLFCVNVPLGVDTALARIPQLFLPPA